MCQFSAIDISNGDGAECALNPYPQSTVPQFIVRRSCDAALACNTEQQNWFQTPPGHNTAQWLDTGVNLAGLTTPNVLIIDGRGALVADNSCITDIFLCTDFFGVNAKFLNGDPVIPECELFGAEYDVAKCANTGGILNHARWPNGIRDGSNNDYEINMLNFLANYVSSP